MFLLPIIAVLALTAVDQITKWLCIKYIKPVGNIEVIKDFFYLSYVENRGAAFGIMHGARWIFIATTICIMIAGAIYYKKLENNRFTTAVRAALVVICSGAAGNFVDRLFRGYVVDMLHFVFWGHSFAVFNFADSLVVCGTIFLGVMIMLSSDEIREIAVPTKEDKSDEQ